jgi:hypothetical protein
MDPVDIRSMLPLSGFGMTVGAAPAWEIAGWEFKWNMAL